MIHLFTTLCAIGFGTLGNAQTLPDPVDDTAFMAIDLDEARLGQLLFYDPILSGNRTVACATCHQPKFGTSDGVALSGGLGTIYGAIIGALIMQSLQSGMAMVGVDAPYQNIVVGAVLVLAVWTDIQYRKRVGAK